VGVTTFATDASRQPTQYARDRGHDARRESAPRYPSNIYYNASNWPDEINEYNTLYVAPGVSLGNPPVRPRPATAPPLGHHLPPAPATEATILASESRIMLSHVLANNPRVGYAHQTDLIGPAANGSDYGYTILSLINDMLSQYNTWTNTPLIQMTDTTEAQVLGLQSAWSSALTSGKVTASEVGGIISITNNSARR
jgi:hypothetical protein